ncbi:MAG: hypothetical protein HOK21_06620 [Rhodospirillaceae bacterium]|jgi:hypothetical protein|nr:hypothetical protein [Rhodospirillaceae bacterium]MBT4045887.1 hypothetical protein [Rhodospirillaceae bacterium]MBT4691605.1 hypothetical protein [Rhodospirillaceae bacterium]MBT5081257.1 hypothetical protein [Rhodospirillaceae bacterium]MBT5523739.1 hypothetical protein [Rhodospirillaceae bacterium]
MSETAEDTAEPEYKSRSAAKAQEIDRALDEGDQDSLHTLPLSILPLNLPSLQRAKMLKDHHMKSMVEMFNTGNAGSGRMQVEALHNVFEETDQFKDDLEILEHMENLHSYDVYSLRIELRRLGISIADQEGLQLSERKAKELTSYMTEFTKPLLQQIYGGGDSEIEDMDQLLAMFKSPDKGEAIKNLRMIADKLGIGLAEVPMFLEEYGDVFLSLAYYKNALDGIIPRVTAFLDELEEINGNFQVRQMPRFEETCDNLQMRFNDITASLTGRFESFDRNSKTLWDDINAATFHAMKEMIEAHYVTIGGVLCGLMVKMDSWDEKFSNGRGGPISKADFIMSEIRMGMNYIYEIEQSAPAIN